MLMDLLIFCFIASGFLSSVNNPFLFSKNTIEFAYVPFW
jgi:hypothetical protein